MIYVNFQTLIPEKTANSWSRRTSFLGCTREVLGQSSFICFFLPVPLGNEPGNPPLDLITKLAKLGKNLIIICFSVTRAFKFLPCV